MLVHSILIIGASGTGKSTFARSALDAEGSGIVVAAPGHDELDSYYGLEPPRYALAGFDDSTYLPTLDPNSKPEGLRGMIGYLREKLAEVSEDQKAGKPPRYAVLVVDTVSAVGQLASNMALSKFKLQHPPPAQSPDGAAYYTYIRNLQDELMRIVRAFKGYGVHIIVLSHVAETEVNEIASGREGVKASKIHTALVPGAFKLALPSYFSTVFHAGVAKVDGKPKHYVQWQPDEKRQSKNRFGDLSESSRVPNNWVEVKKMIEDAAARRIVSQ